MPFDLTNDREQFNSVMLFVPFQADRSGFPDQFCFYLLFYFSIKALLVLFCCLFCCFYYATDILTDMLLYGIKRVDAHWV